MSTLIGMRKSKFGIMIFAFIENATECFQRIQSGLLNFNYWIGYWKSWLIKDIKLVFTFWGWICMDVYICMRFGSNIKTLVSREELTNMFVTGAGFNYKMCKITITTLIHQ